MEIASNSPKATKSHSNLTPSEEEKNCFNSVNVEDMLDVSASDACDNCSSRFSYIRNTHTAANPVETTAEAYTSVQETLLI